jgi:hypothetical protein
MSNFLSQFGLFLQPPQPLKMPSNYLQSNDDVRGTMLLIYMQAISGQNLYIVSCVFVIFRQSIMNSRSQYFDDCGIKIRRLEFQA